MDVFDRVRSRLGARPSGKTHHTRAYANKNRYDSGIGAQGTDIGRMRMAQYSAFQVFFIYLFIYFLKFVYPWH